VSQKEQWDAEIAVDGELAGSLIGEQFRDLAGASILPFGLGWDNTAYLVGGQWVFRFPRRSVAVKLIDREVRLLPTIAPRLPVAIPFPTHLGQPTERYPWPFLGYRLIAGTTACHARLSDEERISWAPPLAAFLRALHGLSADEATALGAPGDELSRLDVPVKMTRALTQLGELHGHSLLNDSLVARLEHVLENTSTPPALRTGTVVHGDLYARHLLADDARALVGVIDWGDIHVGDPAVDVSVVHSFLPPRAYEAFRQAYGALDESSWCLARFRAAYHSLFVARYAHRISDKDLLVEALGALGRIAAAG